MRIVTEVFALIDESALTPREIAVKSGVKISKVIEVLTFLKEFGLVEAEGRRFTVADDVAALPKC